MFTSGDVFDRAAAALNDINKTLYTNAVQIPYLNMACDTLKAKLQLNNVPVTNATSGVIGVPANCDNLGNGGPSLPLDVEEIQQMWQRYQGTDTGYVPIQKYEFLPHYLDGVATSYIQGWAYFGSYVKFLSANGALDVKIDYIASIFPKVTDANVIFKVANALNYLSFETGALCAMYIGENETRAAALHSQAGDALDDILGISSKGKQSIVTRRKPFMMGYRQGSRF